MTDFSTVKKNLEARGFHVSVFDTALAAADYLDAAIDGASVGFGGSVTESRWDFLRNWLRTTRRSGTGVRNRRQTPAGKP